MVVTLVSQNQNQNQVTGKIPLRISVHEWVNYHQCLQVLGTNISEQHIPVYFHLNTKHMLFFCKSVNVFICNQARIKMSTNLDNPKQEALEVVIIVVSLPNSLSASSQQ